MLLCGRFDQRGTMARLLLSCTVKRTGGTRAASLDRHRTPCGVVGDAGDRWDRPQLIPQRWTTAVLDRGLT
jgi:hypothetical protein